MHERNDFTSNSVVMPNSYFILLLLLGPIYEEVDMISVINPEVFTQRNEAYGKNPEVFTEKNEAYGRL